MEVLRSEISGKNKVGVYGGKQYIFWSILKNSTDFQIKNYRKMNDIGTVVFEFNWLSKDKEIRLSQLYLNSHCLHNSTT